MSEILYSGEYYSERHENTLRAAERVLQIVRSVMVRQIKSAADVGCGVGTWLSATGCEDILGFDGEWVPAEHLRIPIEKFVRCDVSLGASSERRFDLAISLECAEHLPSGAAERFVDSLCGLSDFVLFSAAVPNQTGEGHVNEQWPDYWAQLFSKRNYACLDCIRHQVWSEDDIPWWYRQNTMIFVHADHLSDIKPEYCHKTSPLPLVHPRLLAMWVEVPVAPPSIRQAARSLAGAVKRAILRLPPGGR